jgi:hypothetical protein
MPDGRDGEAGAPGVIDASAPHHPRQLASENAACSPDGVGTMTSRGLLKWLLGAAFIGLTVGIFSSPSAGLVIGTAIAVAMISILPRPEDYGNDRCELPRANAVAKSTAPGEWWAADEPAPLVPFHVAVAWPPLAGHRRRVATHRGLVARRSEPMRRARGRHVRAGRAAGRKTSLRKR